MGVVIGAIDGVGAGGEGMDSLAVDAVGSTAIGADEELT